MTIETWIRLTSKPANNKATILVSKMGGAGALGWQFSVKTLGSNNYLVFDGSVNGSSQSQVRSSAVGLNTNTWYHLAMTFKSGTVTFFLDGVAKGTASLSGASSVTLYGSNTAPLRIGSTDAGQGTGFVKFDGIMDEVRISQVIRYVGSFTPSASAFVGD